MAYNMTEMWESRNLLMVFESVNNASNGMFFSIFLLSFFILILMVFPNVEFSKLLVLDSFIITLIAFIGFVIGLCSWWLLIFPIIILGGSILYYMLNK